MEDNIYVVDNSPIFFINVSSFLTSSRFDLDKYHEYDLREPVRNIPFSDKPKTNNIVSTPNTWKNIPYYPMGAHVQQGQMQQSQMQQSQMQQSQMQQGSPQNNKAYQQQVKNAIVLQQHVGKYAYQQQQQHLKQRIGLGGVR
jgi:hypothetical protein